MQKATKTYAQQTSLFGEDSLISSVVGSPASHTQRRGSARAQKMLDISGLKCSVLFESAVRHGYWGKTLLALLVGTKDWYSNRCKLTWKMKGTKYNRLYCQLQVSDLSTDEIESGLWPTPLTQGLKTNEDGQSRPIKTALLPTPVVMDSNQGDLEKIDRRRKRAKEKGINGNGFGATIGELANRGFLPTPLASDCGEKSTGLENQDSLVKRVRSGFFLPTPMSNDWKGARSEDSNRTTHQLNDIAPRLMPTPTAMDYKAPGDHGEGGQDLRTKVAELHPTPTESMRTYQDFIQAKYESTDPRRPKYSEILVPTPTAQDSKNSTLPQSQMDRDTIPGFLLRTGSTGRLSPLFVAEMMGFPTWWTLKPFTECSETEYESLLSSFLSGVTKRLRGMGTRSSRRCRSRYSKLSIK